MLWIEHQVWLAGGEHSDIQRMLIAMLPIIFLLTVLTKFEVLTVQKSCQFNGVTKYNLQGFAVHISNIQSFLTLKIAINI